MQIQKDVQLITIKGSFQKYFNMQRSNLIRIQKNLQVIPITEQLEFLNLKYCYFEQLKEADRLFQKIVVQSTINSSLRYISISRCKVCDGFIDSTLVEFLNNNHQNLRVFSFTFNNQFVLAKSQMKNSVNSNSFFIRKKSDQQIII